MRTPLEKVIDEALHEPLAPVGIRVESLRDRVLDAIEQAGFEITRKPRPVGQPVNVGTFDRPAPDTINGTFARRRARQASIERRNALNELDEDIQSLMDRDRE